MVLGVRPLEPPDREDWIAMRLELWPDVTRGEMEAEAARYFAMPDQRVLPKIVFVAQRGDALIGMIELSLRSIADGCTSSPVPYIEGWFVTLEARREGVGRALVCSAEEWARTLGFDEVGSDVLIGNHASETAHKRLGFEEVGRSILFRKTLP